MTDDQVQPRLAFTIVKKSDREWSVDQSDGLARGPYADAVAALQVATLEALLARKRGQEADICVRDDDGIRHRCQLMDKNDGTERCLPCQNAWLRTAALPPRCPLWAALGTP